MAFDRVSEKVVSNTLASGLAPGKEDCAMERHDCLSCSRRPRNAGGAVVAALNQLTLRRVEEDRPFLPWIVEGARKFFEIAHHPETVLSIGVIEW